MDSKLGKDLSLNSDRKIIPAWLKMVLVYYLLEMDSY